LVWMGGGALFWIRIWCRNVLRMRAIKKGWLVLISVLGVCRFELSFLSCCLSNILCVGFRWAG
jgi:hypothetical protein